MTGAFLGGNWDDKDWFRSSRWNETIEAEFERRLARARPHSRQQYLRIQAVHLCSQPDPETRKQGRRLLLRVIEGGEDHETKAALEQLADNLAAEGMLDEAIEAYRSTLRAIASSRTGTSSTSGLSELALAETLLRRSGPHDLLEARALLDSVASANNPAITIFRHVGTRYLMTRMALHRALGETEVADEFARLALEQADAPTVPIRPASPASPVGLSPADALAAIVQEIAPLLKAAGFRKRRHSFNRRTPGGLTHVVSFQAGASDPPREQSADTFRANMHGKFTVNLSVHVPGMRGSVSSDAWVNEYNGQLRRRLGVLADEHERDVWWDALHPESASDVAGAIRAFGLPWLARFPSADAVLAAWRSDSWEALGMNPASSVDIACLLIRLDRREEAEQCCESTCRVTSSNHTCGTSATSSRPSGWATSFGD